MPRMDLTTMGEIFKSHSIDEAQYDSMDEIRRAGMQFFEAICKHAPECADRSSALRKIREACFDANAAIAMKGLI